MKKSAFITFALLALPIAAQANIVNGDFSGGNTGFSSGYTYTAPTYNALYPESTYTVDTNANHVHNLWSSFGDHTTGAGNYLIVNGTNQPGTTVWQGNNDTALTIGKSYTISAWVSNLYPDNPAALTFELNGNLLSATPFSATGTGQWQKFTATFTATSTLSNFAIRDQVLALGGNDFGIDDIQLTTNAVPEPTSMAALAFGGFALLGRRRRKSA